MNTVYVLIMIFGGSTSQSGYATVQQEFSTPERCEAARKALAERHGGNFTLRAQGCFQK
jgi:hypothetical protein